MPWGGPLSAPAWGSTVHNGGVVPEGESPPNRDFLELSRRAYEAFALAYTPGPPELIPSFRVWHYAAAGPLVSWVVFQCRVGVSRATNPIVRRTTWDRDSDLERLAIQTRRRPRLDPTLATTEAELEEGRLARFVEEASGLSLPRRSVGRPYVSEERPEFGLEGYDVEGRDGRPRVRIQWDRLHPLGLRPIVEWAERVRDWLRASLP